VSENQRPIGHCEQSEATRLGLRIYASVWMASLPPAMTISSAPLFTDDHRLSPSGSRARFSSRFSTFQGFAARRFFLVTPRAAPRPRSRTRSCRFEASEPIPFSGAGSIFSRRCGAICGRLATRLSRLSRRDLGDRTLFGSRDRRSARRQPSPRRRRRNRPRSRFLPHFVTFQGLARRKISRPVATRPPRRSAKPESDVSDRLVPDARSHRPMRAPLRAARRRDLNAVVGHPPAPTGQKVKRVDFKS
jgi:hypothetical protein